TTEETTRPAEIAAKLFETFLTVRLLQFKHEVRVSAGVVGEDRDVSAFFLLVLAHLNRPLDQHAFERVSLRLLHPHEEHLADHLFWLRTQPPLALGAPDFYVPV